MHPFGGTPICPRCNKTVYAAEQAMGPGRKLYHKPCLACTSCNKRLDSLTLLEHDQLPYCKTCHVKNFGTRDLRQANLPHRDDLRTPSNPPPLPPSPIKPNPPPALPQRNSSASPALLNKADPARSATMSPPPILKANSVLPSRYNKSPVHPSFESLPSQEAFDTPTGTLEQRSMTPTFTGTATNSGRGFGGFPRTVPLSPTKSTPGRSAQTTENDADHAQLTPQPVSAMSTGLGPASTAMSPSRTTATGIRYGVALSGASQSPIKQWGGATPICPHCGKSVYFAEQVKAVGKTWHKGCLRCTSCNALLDSTRLTEKDGDPLCHRCYSKLHGPQGSGYGLLGKAGG